jgi:DHA2 family multidrug resistance protein-like MFS transporter
MNLVGTVQPWTGLEQPRRAIAVAAVLAAMTLAVLDAALANVALPTIAQSLHVTPAASVQVVTAYQTALVMALLPCAALGESLGFRRVFTLGVGLFVVASGLCMLAPSLPWLVAARALQGLGSAAIMALGIALLRHVVPSDRLGTAIGWNALTVALASAAGPSIGAFILSLGGWRWLFAINLPVGLAALLFARMLPCVPGTGSRLDLVSMALNAGLFGALVVGAEALPSQPVAGVFLLAMAAAALLALLHRELPKSAPLIPLDLLRRRPFLISVIASICCFTGQAAGMVALPFHLQHEFGQTPWMTGLLMTPWPLTVAVTSQIAGRLSERVPTAWLCAVGGIGLTVGLGLLGLWPHGGEPLALAIPIALCGFGFGLFQVPNNRNMFLAAPAERSGAAGGMQGTARLTGQTLGALLMTLLFAGLSVDAAPRVGLCLAACVTLAAGLVSLLRAGAISR